MNIFKKLLFLLKRPCVILVTGKGRSCAAGAISQILKAEGQSFKIFETDFSKPKEIKKFSFLLKKSRLPILVVTHIGEIPVDKNFFAGEREKTSLIRKIAGILPEQGFLILNFDDETVREVKNACPVEPARAGSFGESPALSLTYGFQKGADFQATDVNINLSGTNFKMNYQGNIIPFWLDRLFGKELIYSALAGICLGTIKKINLVEISQALKSYKSLPGKMRLIEGVRNSLMLDDSKNATLLLMIEALEILGELEVKGRKIAVLGDILGIGKYTIEAHEAVGEKVARNSDLLFTIGLRAHFIAQGARNKGMREENIFKFNTAEEGKIQLQKEIKQNDLILIDGSSEMKMGEIVEEIRARGIKNQIKDLIT